MAEQLADSYFSPSPSSLPPPRLAAGLKRTFGGGKHSAEASEVITTTPSGAVMGGRPSRVAKQVWDDEVSILCPYWVALRKDGTAVEG